MAGIKSVIVVFKFFWRRRVDGVDIIRPVGMTFFPESERTSPARRRPAAAAAPCAKRARGGRPVTGRRVVRMTGSRRQEAQPEQAAALLAGSLELERQAGTRCHGQQNEQLRVPRCTVALHRGTGAGRGVLRKQAEDNTAGPTGPRSENGSLLGTGTPSWAAADPRTLPSRLPVGHRDSLICQ